jgi:elongation factor G
VVEQIENQLGANPLVLHLPVYEEENFIGIIDLINMSYLNFNGQHGKEVCASDIPTVYRQTAHEWHQAMVEKLAKTMKRFWKCILQRSYSGGAIEKSYTGKHC